MALNAQQKRDATKHLHPTVGFMVDDDGNFLKWKSALPKPTDLELEQGYADWQALETKKNTSNSGVKTIIINNGDMIKTLSGSFSECQTFASTDVNALAKTIYLLTNLVVYLAHGNSPELKDYID